MFDSAYWAAWWGDVCRYDAPKTSHDLYNDNARRQSSANVAEIVRIQTYCDKTGAADPFERFR